MKINGTEGQLIDQDELSKIVEAHKELHGEDAGYIKNDTIGIEKLRLLLEVKAVKGIRIYRGNTDRDVVAFVAIDDMGNELTINGLKTVSKAVMSDPPHCPNQC